MNRRAIGLGALAAVLAATVAVGWPAWRRHVEAVRDGESLVHARQAMVEGKAAEALDLVAAHQRRGLPAGSRDAEWADIEIDACAALKHVYRLAAIHEFTPEVFRRHELAAVYVRRMLVERRGFEAGEELRRAWRGRETLHAAWLASDADALAGTGRLQEAIALLKAGRIEGREDASRLMRLALYARDDLDQALACLDEAFRVAPDNPEVRSFRGQVFERAGFAAAARAEYAAACAARPDQPLLFHQLADFYRRCGNAQLAAEAWRAAAARAPLPDFVWLQAWFWSRVAQPSGIDWQAARPLSGSLRSLTDMMQRIPPGNFWDPPAFLRMPGSSALAKNRPEVFWLGVLQALKEGRDGDAADMLRTGGAGDHALAPDLAQAILAVQALRVPPKDRMGPLRPFRPAHADPHPLYVALAAATDPGPAAAPDPALQALIAGREVHAALCLAEGWMEAALTLHDPACDLDAMPAWLTYGLAQSLRMTRDSGAALDFVRARRPTPELTTLVGELQLALDQRPAARETLQPVATNASPPGARAAFLLAIEAFERGDSQRAAACVNGNAVLRDSTAGRELLAEFAMRGGETNRAMAAFRELAAVSPMAMERLAEEAFHAGRLEEAGRLAGALAARHPDEPRLLRNQRMIAAARARTPATP